jgi:hypothetical protein
MLWLRTFTNFLIELGFGQVPSSECLLLSDHLVLFFYVDDIIVLYRHSAQAQFKAFPCALLACYGTRELGELKWFPNIQLIRDCPLKKLSLCHDSYVSNIAS